VSTPAVAPRANPFTHRQILAILSGLLIGMFLAALDNTIVATSVRTIADDLHGLSVQAWATTAYLVTSTISTPLYGKLSDLLGRRPLFLVAISVFVTGSAACAFAGSMYQLAAFRALQGLGAGGLFALALTIIGDIVAPRERARYQGYFVAVFGTSSVLGPLVGGFLAGREEILGITGWRWVFLINVPLGILALLVVARVLHVPHTRREVRIDWAGAVALGMGLVPLLIIAEQGRAWGWDSPWALLCYGVGAVGVVAFVLVEHRMGEHALLPLRFFRNNVFGWGTVAAFVVGMGMFGAIAMLPLFLQIVRGASPTLAGLQTLPLMAGIMTMSVMSGQTISRTGRHKVWPVLGTILMITGMLLLGLAMRVDTPYWQVALTMALVGLGLGGLLQPLTLAVQNAMPPRDMGVATASSTFFRQLGGTVGTAAFLSLLFGALPTRIADGFRAAAATPGFRAALADPVVAADPANAPILAALHGGVPPALDDSSFLIRADPRLAEPVLAGFASSMSTVLLGAAAVLAVALVAVLLIREVPLRTVSGVEARRGSDPSVLPTVTPAQAVPAASAEPARPPTVSAAELSGQSTNGCTGTPGPGPAGAGPAAGPPAGDTRDRLLALLLPDAGRALAAVAAAERARSAMERARAELDARATELARASQELVAQGLTGAQVERLLTGRDAAARRPRPSPAPRRPPV